MRAVVLHRYGGPEVLEFEETLRPEPKDDEALIRIVAASVNPVDVAIRSGKYAEYFHTSLPLIPGMDAAGIVEKTGTSYETQSGRSGLCFLHLAERRRLCRIRGREGK